MTITSQTVHKEFIQSRQAINSNLFSKQLMRASSLSKTVVDQQQEHCLMIIPDHKHPSLINQQKLKEPYLVASDFIYFNHCGILLIKCI